ncbi:MAG: Tll0287-like domain-containing protein, partial [Verrucomicrobiales bacterium]
GLTITRVTDRLRNPENAPDKADLRALEHFKKAKPERQLLAHLTTGADGKTLRYYKPLIANETCLKCHGDRDAMSEKLRGLLDEHYPDDKAHGYSIGDLRGLIRVEQKPVADNAE